MSSDRPTARPTPRPSDRPAPLRGRDSELLVVHVYPHLLGTYGDAGNALVLHRRALARGIAAQIVARPAIKGAGSRRGPGPAGITSPRRAVRADIAASDGKSPSRRLLATRSPILGRPKGASH